MGKSDYSVKELVAKIERGELQLPEMQRKYVWTATKVRDLLDSLYRGYPSGVILTWQPSAPVETQRFAIATSSPATASPLLLLDGQQRLTSLSAVLRGEAVEVKNRKRPVDILFNLDHPDELTFVTEVDDGQDAGDETNDGDDTESDLITRANRRVFVVSSNQIAALPNWVKVSEVFRSSDAEMLKDAGVLMLSDPKYDRFSARLKKLRAIADYSYRVDILEPSMSYEEVTEIFVRVNSLGAKLRSSDLALAQITAKWTGSLALFNGYRQEVANRGFDFDLGVHLKTLVSIITGQSRFAAVAKLTRAELEEGWKKAKRATDFALNFIQQNIGVDSPTLLSSPFLIIATAYWSEQMNYKISDVQAREFRKWFLLANAKARYSRGSSETLLDQDLLALRGEEKIETLTQRLVQQVGRLDFTPSDLVGRTARSGAFKTIFLAFRESGARDWATNLAISPKLAGKSDKIEFHHVFPKACMKKFRSDLDQRDVDDIANLVFISASTNKAIGSKAPSVYAKDYSSELLSKQLVVFSELPEDGDPAAFEEFLAKRRELIASKLNKFLDVG